MGNMHIVTGFKGANHVTAADVGSLNAAIFGTGSYVLNRGSKFSTTTVSNNKIRVNDGDLLIQGRHVRLNEGTYVELAVENGTQGYKRNDLIIARYTKDSNSGIEDVELMVIKGTPGSTADPAITEGDIINDHVYLADVPLYRIPLDGLNIGTLVPLFTEAQFQILDGSITTEKLAQGSVSKNYTTTISAGWAGSTAPYTKSVSVPGILATDTPIIDLIADQNWETAQKQIEAWSCVYRATTSKDTVTFFSTDPVEVALPVQIKAIRR